MPRASATSLSCPVSPIIHVRAGSAPIRAKRARAAATFDPAAAPSCPQTSAKQSRMPYFTSALSSALRSEEETTACTAPAARNARSAASAPGNSRTDGSDENTRKNRSQSAAQLRSVTSIPSAS